MNCELCRVTPESAEHLFLNCPVIQPLKTLLFSYLPSYVSFTIENIIHFNFTSFQQHDLNYNIILISEYLLTIWALRNKTIFEEDPVVALKTFSLPSTISNPSYGAKLCGSFHFRIKSRIMADFYRLDESFFTSLWCKRPYRFNLLNNKIVFV
jgi:hypothetical protein